MGLAMAKQRRRKPYLEQGQLPTPERLAKAAGDWEQGRDARGRETGVITMRDSPLERLLAREKINGRQYEAGVKYRHHWYRAGLSGALASIDPNRVYAAGSNMGGFPKTDDEMFHRNRFRLANEALDDLDRHIRAGAVTSVMVADRVLCREHALETAGYMLGWGSKPQAIAVATERLKLVLEKLISHWGL